MDGAEVSNGNFFWWFIEIKGSTFVYKSLDFRELNAAVELLCPFWYKGNNKKFGDVNFSHSASIKARYLTDC